MKWRLIQLIFFKELREFVRDTRTLLLMIFIPAFLYPGLLVVTSQMKSVQQGKMEATQYEVYYEGQKDPWLKRLESEKALQFSNSNKESSVLQVIFPDVDLDDLGKQSNDIEIKVVYDSTNNSSSYALSLLERALRKVEMGIVADRLKFRKLNEQFTKPLKINVEKSNSEAQEGRFLAGKFLPGIVLIMLTVAAGLIAQENSAGEKEGGTMETLLCAPAKTSELVLAKLLTVGTVGVISGLLNVIFMGLTFSNVGYMLAQSSTSEEMVFPSTFLPSLISIPFILVVVLLTAFMIAAIALFLSTAASTRQEASHYMSPFLIIMLLPVLYSSMPGVQNDALNSMIPGLNFCLIMQQLFIGELPWTYLLLFILSNGIVLLFVLRLIVRVLESESYWSQQSGVMTAFRLAGRGKSQANLYPDEVAMVFMTSAALYLLLGMRFQTWNLAMGLPLSQFLILAGLPLFYLKITNRNFKEVLCFKRPPLKASILAICAVPAFVILGAHLKWFCNTIGIQSSEDGAADVVGMLLEGHGLYITLAIVALTPAICEELLFRGVMLNGLRKFSLPVILIIEGALFAAMHMSLANFPVLALMGAFMAYLVICSGSIAVSMIFHILNNGLAVLLGAAIINEKIAEESVENFVMHKLTFVVALVVALTILYILRNESKKSQKNQII